MVREVIATEIDIKRLLLYGAGIGKGESWREKEKMTRTNEKQLVDWCFLFGSFAFLLGYKGAAREVVIKQGWMDELNGMVGC